LRAAFGLEPGWSGPNHQIRWAGPLAVVGCAIVLGSLVANEDWLYIGILAGGVLALLWPVQIALGLYAFLLPFDSIAVLGESQSGTTVNWVVGALAAMALLATGVFMRCLDVPPKAARIWASLLVWSLITVAWALQPQAAIRLLPTAISLVLLYVLAVSWRVTKKQFDVLTWLTIAGGCVASLYVIYLDVTGVTWRHLTRASLLVAGRETNPDLMGAVLILPLSLAIAGFVTAVSRLQKTVFLGIAAAIGSAVFLSMSRAALIAVAAIFVVFLIRLGPNRRIVTVISTLLLGIVAMPSTFFSRIREAVATGGAGRLDIWRGGISVLKQYWLTGAGLNNFPVAYNDFAGRGRIFEGYGRGSHNTYLNVLCELGIVGFLLLVAGLVAHLRSVQRLRSVTGKIPVQVVGFEAACWAMLVFSFFADDLWSKAFWLDWILLLMAVRVAEKSLNAPSGRTSSG
jgi:putative inorganic carbon (hco3(-)) transporter